jgi:hypothetical protein
MYGYRLLPLLICILSLHIRANILPILPHPNANELASPVVVDTFAGLNITSFSGGIGTTEPFFDTSDIPGLSMNIWGNFQAFDPLGNPTSFTILGMHVTEGGSTFTPPFGSLNFAGHPSLTFTDSQTFDMVTFNASDPTLAFPVNSSGGDFQVTIDTDLALGSSFTFQAVDTGTIPEPGTLLLLSTGLGMVTFAYLRRQRHKNRRTCRTPKLDAGTRQPGLPTYFCRLHISEYLSP